MSSGQALDRFLASAGWSAARRVPLAGDASSRRYSRLIRGTGRAVLMQAPPGSLGPFLGIARHLRGLGFSAPEIIAEDDPAGLLLLEDLGDDLFARLLDTAPDREPDLYGAAADLLLALRSAPLPTAPDYGADKMVAAIDLAHDWYGRTANGRPDPDGQAETQAALTRAYDALPAWHATLALRDFHAENLFWLPRRAGLARVGLIDFQDAVLSHPLYDLVSLTRDVRRSVSPATQSALLDRWAHHTGEDRAAIAQAAATLGAQRNLRILGIFTRLAVHAGKTGYLALLPGTWARLTEDLAHPALADLHRAVACSLPPPTAEIVARIEDRCPARLP